MSDSATATQRAFNGISTGKQVNQDSWMIMWCDTNWGEMLQPAPLSIALLGSALILASSTDDFSLLTKENPHEPGPSITWKYARHPDSFKACLLQMVYGGYTAFEGAHDNMARLRNATSRMPQGISTVVSLIVQGTPDDIKLHLKNQIDAVLQLVSICKNAASACETAFDDLSGLSQELALACVHRVCKGEEVVRANENHLESIEKRKEAQEKIIKVTEQATELMKTSFQKAQNDFRKALKRIPTGPSLLSVNFVDSLCTAVTSTSSLPLSMAFRIFDLYRMQNAKDGARKADRNVTLEPNAALDDPGVHYVYRVFEHVRTIKMLITGGPNGGTDWENLAPKQDGTSIGAFIEYDLEKNILPALQPGDKELSQQLLVHVNEALEILNRKIYQAQSSNRLDGPFKEDESKVTRLMTCLEALVMKVNLILLQSGIHAVGPATPALPSKISPTTAKYFVENARFKIDQTRAHLAASREAFSQASTQLIARQEEISETIAEMKSLKQMTFDLTQILPVLKNTVKTFTALREHFSKINRFFVAVADMLRDVMSQSVDEWAKTMSSINFYEIGGVTLSQFTRHLMYTKMMVPLKSSMLSEKISVTYLEVSSLYILPAQRNVGTMLSFSPDSSPDGVEKFRAKLLEQHDLLKHKCSEASRKIGELIEKDRQTFVAQIDKRLNDITRAMKPYIPTIEDPVPQAITSIMKTHMEEIALERNQETDAQFSHLKELM